MPSRFQPLILFALGLAFGAVFAAPVASALSSQALGAECGLASQELWALWHSIADSSAGGLGFPGLDALPTIAAPTIWIASKTLAQAGIEPIASWNALFGVAYVVLTLGCISLGRRISPNSPFIAQLTLLIAVVGCASWSPLLRQVGASIIPMMLVPMVLAQVHAWMHPDAHWRHGVAAAALFVAACLGSWGTSALVMLMTPTFAVVLGQRIEGHQARRRIAGALAPGLAAGCIHVALTHTEIHPLVVDAAALGPAWMTYAKGALALPATAAVALPSLGILLLALAGIASRPHITVGWLLTATWGILLAAATTSPALPVVHLADAFPPLAEMEAWWAVAPLVSIPLGIAAMHGVEALHRAQRDTLAMGVLALALLDQTIPLLTPTGPQRFSVAPPASLVEALRALPNGGVLQLPQTPLDCAHQDKLRLWQPIIRRPVSTAAWNGSDGAEPVSYIARLARELATAPPRRASHEAALGPPTFQCAVQDIFTLRDIGFAAVTVDKSAEAHPALMDGLRMVLGEPAAEDALMAVWSLVDAEPGDRGTPCPLPPR